MNSTPHNPLSITQQVALVSLRTVVGWHFLYEAYYKLALPGWSSSGVPLPRWSSAAYLKGAPGPLAGLFLRLIESGWAGWIDNTVKFGLLLIGFSLILGLFTRTGCIGAIVMLTLFYLTSIPLSGVQQPGSEGAYLIVNKTLIEGLAVCTLLAFRTEKIAGLDLLLKSRTRRESAVQARVTAPASTPATAIAADSVHLSRPRD